MLWAFQGLFNILSHFSSSLILGNRTWAVGCFPQEETHRGEARENKTADSSGEQGAGSLDGLQETRQQPTSPMLFKENKSPNKNLSKF